LRTVYVPIENSKSVEDEIHFLMYCPKFENHRRELFSNVLNYNAAILSAEAKFVWILSNEIKLYIIVCIWEAIKER
jgi:hypothetical protein